MAGPRDCATKYKQLSSALREVLSVAAQSSKPEVPVVSAQLVQTLLRLESWGDELGGAEEVLKIPSDHVRQIRQDLDSAITEIRNVFNEIATAPDRAASLSKISAWCTPCTSQSNN